MSDWQVVRTLGTDEEATLVVGFLESHGVRAEIESLLFHQEPVTFGRLGEVRVRVAEHDAERARELLAGLPAGGARDDGGATEGEAE